MSEFITNIDKYPSAMIILAVVILLIEITRKIYNFSEKIKSGKLKKYIEYSSLQGITLESKKHILECLENYIFQETTGINAEKKLREEIIVIHNSANGFLTYANFKRGFSYLKIKKGKLYVKVGLVDWFFALNDLVISIYLFGFGTLLAIDAYSLIYISTLQVISLALASFIVYLISAYHFNKVFSLRDVYIIKVFLDNPQLNYYVQNENNKS